MSEARAGCMSVVCSMQQCAMDVTVLRELEVGARSGLYSWHPANYTDIWGLSLLQEIHHLNYMMMSSSKLFLYHPSTITSVPRLRLSKMIMLGDCR